MTMLLLFFLIQYNDTIADSLMSLVEQKYNNDTTFRFQKLTTFPELKGEAHYWNYSFLYDGYRNENVVYKLGNSYIVGVRFTYHDGNKIFYLYQADQYEKQTRWIQKRKTKICVEASNRSKIIFYKDEIYK